MRRFLATLFGSFLMCSHYCTVGKAAALASDTLESILSQHLPEKERHEVFRILYGRQLNPLSVRSEAETLSVTNGFDIKLESLVEKKNSASVVRLGLIQHSLVEPTTDAVSSQYEAIVSKVEKIIDAAGLMGVQVLGLQEAWTMPFAFCTREKQPWTDFAEDATNGPTAEFIKGKAREWNMVIISPILERDDGHMGVLWNTAVVIDNNGQYLGAHRKNHIPRVGDFNESTYYLEGNTGHPVFETVYGRIAVNICYGRHIPLNWLGFALNGAEIVFNPSATVDGLSEPLWGIEGRAAAVANNYFVASINRVGTEVFPNAFTSGDGKPAHKDFGQFYGSSYVTAPDGRRTMSLSRTRNGLLAVDVDVGQIKETRDKWMFQSTSRYEIYAKLLSEYSGSLDYKPQRVSSRKPQSSPRSQDVCVDKQTLYDEL